MGTTLKAFDAPVQVKTVGDERQIVAVVSSTSVDRDQEIVDVPSLRLPLKGGGYVVARDLTGQESVDIPFLLNHSFDVEDVIGSVRSAFLNDQGELVNVFGVSARQKAQDLMTLIDEAHLDNAFSITMTDFTFDETTNTIYDAEVIEVSLVFRGSNKDARLLQVKSLIKGEHMAEATTLEEKRAALEALTKEIDAEEATKVIDSIQETPQPVEVAVEVEEADQAQDETTAESAPEALEATEAQETDVEPEESKQAPAKQRKQEIPTMEKSIAVKQVQDAPEAPATEAVRPTLTKDAQRALFVEQFLAYQTKNLDKLAELNQKAQDADTPEHRSKILGELVGPDPGVLVGVNSEAIYQTEVVAQDIVDEYGNYGNVGKIVNRVDILGAERYKTLFQADGTGFQPVGFGGVKDEGNPVWTSTTITPHEHAVIVAWYDQVAKKSPLAVYQQLVKWIAKQYAKLEDNIVLSFLGGTFDGEVYEATGLQPALVNASRQAGWDGQSPSSLAMALGTAYGAIASDGPISLVMSRGTLAVIASSSNVLATPITMTNGDQITSGALGSFNVVISDVVTPGEIVVGDFSDYTLVTRGGLETMFSREATVGTVNLFTQDASALRACVAISGGSRLESFYLITNG